ncbi:MAG TPA: LysR family transcriptional regulator [Chloroflexota bacterium]|jgi:molybdate transport system regulatory protein
MGARPREVTPERVGVTALSPRSKVWLERDGRVVLSEWRAALLDGIVETGSLAGAAARLGVPYRTAWARLREIEAGLGFKVLDTQTGGAEGGGSTLTPAGLEVLARFHRVADGVDALVDARFRTEFGADA